MVSKDILKPIRIFSYCFLLVGFIGLAMHFTLKSDIRYTFEFKCFLLISTFFHVVIGIGLAYKKKWGFYFLKFYLYMLYLAIPIGTYISIKMFKYIQKHQIEKAFF